MSASNYIDSLNWGTSTAGSAGSAETSDTLGLERADLREPSTKYHVSNLGIERLRQLGLAMSTTFKGGTRLGALTQTSSPFSASEHGIWVDTAGKFYTCYLGASRGIRTSGATTAVAFSATPTFAKSLGDYLTITMTGNITSWTFTAGTDGDTIAIAFIQDGTGSRTLAAGPSTVVFAGGSPTLTTTASKRDIFNFRYNGTLAKWEEQSRSMNV